MKHSHFGIVYRMPVVFLLASAGGMSCAPSDSVEVTTTLLKISAAATSNVSGQSLRAAVTTATTKTNEGVVVDSYKRTVGGIGLNSGTELTGAGAAQVYSCPGTTNADCLVDYAAAGAVENLLSGGGNVQSITPGTFTFATVQNCAAGGQPGPTYVKAHAKFNGTWWYTTAATGVSTPYLSDSGIADTADWVAPADYDLATLPPGNGCATYNVFAKPLTLEKGAPVNVKLFFELRGLIRLDTTAGTLQAGNCFVPDNTTTNGTSPYFCSSMPYLAGTIDAETPELQRYLVTRGSGAELTAMVYGFYLSKGTTSPLGAYSYEYFNSTYAYPSNWSEIVKSLSSTSDGVLTVVNYGKNGNDDPNTINSNPGGFNTTSFTLLDAVGDTGTVTYTDHTGASSTVDITRLE